MRHRWCLLSILMGLFTASCGERDTPPPVEPPPPAAPTQVAPASTLATQAAPEKMVTIDDFKGRIGLMVSAIDLGTLPEGTPKTGIVTIVNGLDQPVEIRRVAGDCSCVKWEFKGFQKIPAKGSLTVAFTLKPTQLYSKKKLPFEVITSSNVTPRLDGTLTYECVSATEPASPPAATGK